MNLNIFYFKINQANFHAIKTSRDSKSRPYLTGDLTLTNVPTSSKYTMTGALDSLKVSLIYKLHS